MARGNKMKLLTLLPLLLLSSISHAKDTVSAYPFVSHLYANYTSKNSALFDFSDSGADTIFTPDLLKLIRMDQEYANGEVGFINEDPFCSCQDRDGLKIDKITITKSDSISNAKIQIKFPSETKIIYLRLKKIKGKWLVDDAIDSTSLPGLYKYLSESLAGVKRDTTKK